MSSHHYLVGTDGSQSAEHALTYALSLAADTGAAVTVAHVVSPSVYAAVGIEPISDIADADQRLVIEGIEAAERRGESILADAVAAAETDGPVDSLILYGDPVDELVRYAENGDVTAIFVGHRGLSERAERLLGSVAKDLVERSPVPVTVVR